MENDTHIVWFCILIVPTLYFLWESRYKIILYFAVKSTIQNFKELKKAYTNSYSKEYYSVAFIFEKCSERIEAEEKGLNEEINEYFKKCMKKYLYPKNHIHDCTFVSQEECNAEANGSWYLYFRL